MRLGYAWRLESLYPGTDANAVGDRLSELEAEHGSLNRELILQESKYVKSPLYPFFERDATKALARLQGIQVAQMLGNLVVTKNGRKTQQRAFVYVEPSAHQRKAFVSLVVAMRTPTLREQVVERAVHDLDRWFDRYGSLREFKPIKKDLQAIRAKIEADMLAAV